MPSDSTENEINRIRKFYEARDARMPYNDWSKNTYHLRHPLGKLLRNHDTDNIVRALNHLEIDLNTLKILDVGCGYGFWLRYMVELGAHPGDLTGVDLSPERIDIAKGLNPAINWIHNEGTTLPFAPGSFDIVMQFVVFSSIHDTDSRKFLSREMCRVVKPNGMIFWIDLKKKRTNLHGFNDLQVSELFPDFRVIYRKLVHPYYFRRLHNHSAILADLLYHITKIGCDSLFLIMQKTV